MQKISLQSLSHVIQHTITTKKQEGAKCQTLHNYTPNSIRLQILVASKPLPRFWQVIEDNTPPTLFLPHSQDYQHTLRSSQELQGHQGQSLDGSPGDREMTLPSQ